MTRPFSLPWQVNGSAPAGHLGAEPGEGRVARGGREPAHRSPRRRRDRGDRAARPGRRRRARRPAAAAPAARASTAAARAALPQLAIARSGRASGSASPSRSATSRWSSTPMRCRPLCDPVTLPVSSLTHTPPDGAEPEPVRQRVVPAEGRGPEAASPTTRATASSRRHDDLADLVVAHARRRRAVVAVQEPAVVHERRPVSRRAPPGSGRGRGRGPGPGRGPRRRPRPRDTGTGRAPAAPATAPQPQQTSRLAGGFTVAHPSRSRTRRPRHRCAR